MTTKEFYPPDYNKPTTWQEWGEQGGPIPGQIVKKDSIETWQQHNREMKEHTENLIRKFSTGATRDTAEGKYEYNGFNSPLVEKRFAEYMHLHRKQSDGQLRSSSNWKKGLPIDTYIQSMHRHFMDLWLHTDGFKKEAVEKEDIESILCAIRFNVNGMLHEILKKKYVKDL
jgi:hypothetical protein